MEKIIIVCLVLAALAYGWWAFTSCVGDGYPLWFCLRMMR